MAEHAYQKLMQENSLTLEQLPQDAKIGIKTIADIEKSINMMEKTGKKVSDKVLQKLKANDKWVVREITDHIEGTKKNEEPLPNPAAVVIAEIKEEGATGEVVVDSKGVAIDKELAALIEAGKTTFTIEELKSASPTSYTVIFDAYKEGEENGIETTFHKLIETEKQTYILTKK